MPLSPRSSPKPAPHPQPLPALQLPRSHGTPAHYPGGWARSIVSQTDIDGRERVVLSVGFSLAIVPLLGLMVNGTRWGVRLPPLLVAVSGVTLVATAVAAGRRHALPPEARFRVPYRAWYAAGRTAVLAPATRADAALHVLLAVAIILAAGSVGYAVLLPPAGEEFSAIYLLTETDDGELVADGYPTEFVAGESREVIVGIVNHEGERTEYTVVVLEQTVAVADNETATTDGAANVTANETVVREQRELDRFDATVAANESWHQPYDLAPTMTGQNQRIVWLLFPDGEVPAEPSRENAAYAVHLWVSVAES